MTRPADNEVLEWPLSPYRIKPHSLRGSGKILNRVLLALPAEVSERVLCGCQRVEFPAGHVIYRAGAAVEDILFVDSGLVSLVKSMPDGRSVEVGAVGREGVIGVFAAAGFDHALTDYVAHVPLAALRIRRSVLQRQMLEHEALRGAIMKYLFLLFEQLAQISACNRLHSLEQRCCHWLLVADDNISTNEFRLTHEFLSLLLGVQRPSLSIAANRLQKGGLIRYCHGRVKILNRAALEESACECYGTQRRQIDELFGPESLHPELVRQLHSARPKERAFHENLAVKPSGT